METALNFLFNNKNMKRMLGPQKLIILLAMAVSLLYVNNKLVASTPNTKTIQPQNTEINSAMNFSSNLETREAPQLKYQRSETCDDPKFIASIIIDTASFCFGLVLIVSVLYSFFKWLRSKEYKEKKIAKRKLIVSIICLFILIAFYAVIQYAIDNTFRAAKPVIYLYPEHRQETTVKLDFQGKLIADYPKYNKEIGGWDVTAFPDGRIINHADNLEYSYLFWEGKLSPSVNWNFSSGFIVRGEDTREFLREILIKIGLTPKEYNEFIVYWYPLMKDNRYNLIHFAHEQYTDIATLNITPEPDSMLRVFMVYKALTRKIDIEPQAINPFKRKGFTVVEWGGTEID